MEPIELVTRWIWKPERLIVRIVEIRGGKMPYKIRSKMQQSSPPDFDSSTKYYKMANSIVQYIAQKLPQPEPIEIGGEGEIKGEITGIQLFDSRTSDDKKSNYISYYVEYQNGLKTEGAKTFGIDEFPKPIADLIIQLHLEVNKHLKEYFWSNFGEGEINPTKWKAEKVEVFISYRSAAYDTAQIVFNALGEYQNSSIFLPRIDAIDLQAGNWMEQLMMMIDKCKVFIPILTHDYLEGPISRPELDQALRQAFSNQDKRIVPILIKGHPKDYENHFIGGFHMVLARDGITHELVEKIAYLSLGISQNPFEK